MSKKILEKARVRRKDEFYTQLTDIEKELKYYKEQFYGKIVYCNCDDPYNSKFFKFFVDKFDEFKLKKLITTNYNYSPTKNSLFNEEKEINFKVEILKKPLIDNIEYLLKNDKNIITPLNGDGDFRNVECIKILKEADIVVTNPPFSLFREYIAQLTEYNKKFLIIGNTNSISYKETFKLFRKNKIRTGYTNFNVGMFFIVPNEWEEFHHVDENGNKVVRVSTSCWFTNLEVKKHKEFLTLYKHYNSEEYPKYDNYNAIEVSKYLDIPINYDGIMGVPITFVDKYNPEQFEIIDINPHFFTIVEEGLEKPSQLKISGRKDPYARILIKRRQL